MPTEDISQLEITPADHEPTGDFTVGGDLHVVGNAGVDGNLDVKGGPWFDVKAFGAIGDGIINDTSAIQAALAAAGEGGTFFFPKGTYLITAALNPPNKSRLLGAGGSRGVQTGEPPPSVIKRTSGNAAIISTGSRQVIIERLGFKGA